MLRSAAVGPWDGKTTICFPKHQYESELSLPATTMTALILNILGKRSVLFSLPVLSWYTWLSSTLGVTSISMFLITPTEIYHKQELQNCSTTWSEYDAMKWFPSQKPVCKYTNASHQKVLSGSTGTYHSPQFWRSGNFLPMLLSFNITKYCCLIKHHQISPERQFFDIFLINISFLRFTQRITSSKIFTKHI
jgi:hypothetical protein